MVRLQQIFITLTLIVTLIQAQDLRVVLAGEQPGDTINVPVSNLNRMIDVELSNYQSLGYWDAEVKLSASESDSNLLFIKIDQGPVTKISQIHFSGLSPKDERYVMREFMLGAAFLESTDLGHAERRISNLGYRKRGDVRISKDRFATYHLDYTIHEKPELNAEALASFNRSATADTLAWYGQVSLYAPNLDGKGKGISLEWKRLKTNSELLSLRYEHPWIFDIPLAGALNFEREVIDGNYQTVQSGVGLSWSLDWDKSLIFEYQYYQSLITHSGAQANPQWNAEHRRMLGLGFRQTNLDRTNHKGISLRSSLQQQINFEPSSMRRFELRTEAEQVLLPKLYISQRSSWIIQNQSQVETDPSILNPLGGISSVRGYEENIVRSPSTISLQHDIHFQLGAGSQLLALFDVGIYYHDNSIRSMNGYGVGVQLASGRGPIRIILASHEGIAFRNSFLHIEYAGGISWIDR